MSTQMVTLTGITPVVHGFGAGAPVDSLRKMLESLQADLKTLSNEAKKKYPHVKEAAESGIIKARNVSTRSGDLLTEMRNESADIMVAFVHGCDTKNPKLVLICVGALQKMICHECLSHIAAANMISSLWHLMETGVEELKLLQTVTLLLTTNTLVQGELLARALVLCLRLHFTKDSTTNNTASATVRQLVSLVFERVITEDAHGEPSGNQDIPEIPLHDESQKSSKQAPKTLNPCAADAYLMFQDLVQLVNAEQPFWLVGLMEMTRTFGLELVESVLVTFSDVFFKHHEFSFLLKERVCPLVIKLFSPNIKYRQSSFTNLQSVSPNQVGVQPPAAVISIQGPPAVGGGGGGGTSMASGPQLDKPYFPISMRLLRVVSVLVQKYHHLLITECEIFLSLVVKFLDPDKPGWQRCLALEVLHRLTVQPPVLAMFCQSYDMKQHSTKIFQDTVNALAAFVQSLFVGGNQIQGGSGGSGAGPSNTPGQSVASGPGVQSAYFLRGVWIPVAATFPAGVSKPFFLDMLDKLECPPIPDGYGLSVAVACLMEVVRSIQITVVDEPSSERPSTSTAVTSQDGDRELHEQLITSSWCGLLAALSLLLDASTDEQASETIFKCFQTLAATSGKLGMDIQRDAFVTALCKASLPPHYALTILNTTGVPKAAYENAAIKSDTTINMGQYFSGGIGGGVGSADGSELRHHVVAVGTPLPTASTSNLTQQGPVMLISKNLQCMRALLTLALCHGNVLGSSWRLVLTTLQHLVWILGLKPNQPNSSSAMKSASLGRGINPVTMATDQSNAVLTTAVMVDLPVLSAMLSRLFDNSKNLGLPALKHLIETLCNLSQEAMDLAYINREPSLFAAAKLLETRLANLDKTEEVWKPITTHLLQVCQHPHVKLRELATESVTTLVKDAVALHNVTSKENQAQVVLLSPLVSLSTGGQHADVRQRQLECVLQILHANGESLTHGWPSIISIIGSLNDNHGEALVRLAFQCLQLVVSDFLPIMPRSSLRMCIYTAAKFGAQQQELNVSLTAVGLLWNISDYLYQNQDRLRSTLTSQDLVPTGEESSEFEVASDNNKMAPFDKLWMCMFTRLGDLCVDARPAIRKSAGQTLFSTIGVHGELLERATWESVLWHVLFPLLDQVKSLSGLASNEKTDQSGNILMHHSRNTAHKQWAETQVLALSGVARVFSTKRDVLQSLSDFPRAWALLLEFIDGSALSGNNEVSLAALKSFQEILTDRPATTPSSETAPMTPQPPRLDQELNPSVWINAWNVWHNIGITSTTGFDGAPRDGDAGSSAANAVVRMAPSQPFLAALVQIFVPLFQHIKTRFSLSNLNKLCTVLQNSICVPLQGTEASIFLLPPSAAPSQTGAAVEHVLTPLQDVVVTVLDILQKEALAEKAGVKDGLKAGIPVLFAQMLTFTKYACRAPLAEHRTNGSTATNRTVDWLTLSYVPFGEKVLQMAVDLYGETAKHKSVIEEKVLTGVVKTLRLPLSLKYNCPSPSTWRLAIGSFLTVLQTGLPVVRQQQAHLNKNKRQSGGDCPENSPLWDELALALDEFLFAAGSPVTLSLEEQQGDEAIDCKVIDLLRTEVLPHACLIPDDFILKVMTLLNKGSIHSASGLDILADSDTGTKLREEFAKLCFETLLQYSYLDQCVKPNGAGATRGPSGVSRNQEETPTNRMAVTALLYRFQEVVEKYVEDERLSGKCPLPRHRMAEISFVLKAISTLVSSLKKAPPIQVEQQTWQQLIDLYPHLVNCTLSTSPQVHRALQDALHQYHDFLSPPLGPHEKQPVSNGSF